MQYRVLATQEGETFADMWFDSREEAEDYARFTRRWLQPYDLPFTVDVEEVDPC